MDDMAFTMLMDVQKTLGKIESAVGALSKDVGELKDIQKRSAKSRR